MGYSLFSHYSTGIYPRPADDIDPKKKNEAWMLGWCRYIFGYGSRESNLTPYSRQDYIRRLRSYAEGSQDQDQYYKRFYDETTVPTPVGETDYDNDDTYRGRSNQREAYLNVNWEILPVFPKYLQLLLGKFDAMEHEIVANAVDPKSGDERENEKWFTWFESDQRKQLDGLYGALGIERPIKSDFLPNSIEELELYETMGGFKLKHEIAIQKIIKHSLNISNWYETIKRKMIQDMVVIGLAACKDYTDIRDGKVKSMYLDPERL
ncbi:MAG: hypothetical protein K0U41_05730, partial [Gammaproteobacteria bacterium]|nr:hypothetical protein [Gammaproteobacteria bacterium]